MACRLWETQIIFVLHRLQCVVQGNIPACVMTGFMRRTHTHTHSSAASIVTTQIMLVHDGWRQVAKINS